MPTVTDNLRVTEEITVPSSSEEHTDDQPYAGVRVRPTGIETPSLKMNGINRLNASLRTLPVVDADNQPDVLREIRAILIEQGIAQAE